MKTKSIFYLMVFFVVFPINQFILFASTSFQMLNMNISQWESNIRWVFLMLSVVNFLGSIIICNRFSDSLIQHECSVEISKETKEDLLIYICCIVFHIFVTIIVWLGTSFTLFEFNPLAWSDSFRTTMVLVPCTSYVVSLYLLAYEF